jgi:hypothetical protein
METKFKSVSPRLSIQYSITGTGAERGRRRARPNENALEFRNQRLEQGIAEIIDSEVSCSAMIADWRSSNMAAQHFFDSE